MWLSVPPVSTVYPSACNSSDRAFALSTTRFIVAWKSPLDAIARARALAAIEDGSGVPWKPGKTARCMSCHSLVRPSGPVRR